MYNKFTAVKVSNIDFLTLLTNLRRAKIQRFSYSPKTKFLIESKNK